MNAVKNIIVEVELENILSLFNNLKRKMIGWAKADNVTLPLSIAEWEIQGVVGDNLIFEVFSKGKPYQFKVSIYDILREAEKLEKNDFAFSNIISASDPKASDEDVVIDYKIVKFNPETEIITMDVTYA